jgi:hypothetical protein
VAVVTVAVVVGEALQGRPGAVPVAAPAGGVAVWFGAQQPAQVGPALPLVGRRPPARPAALVVTAFVVAAVPGSLAGPVGRPAGERRGRGSRPVGSGHRRSIMLRWRWVVEAVGAPVAVQFRGGRAPHPPLARVGGDEAELGQQPAWRVQGQGALVDSAPPGILPRHRPLLSAQVGVVGFHPALVPLLGTAQDAEPLGRLVGLAGGRAQPMLGQHQPLPDRV